MESVIPQRWSRRFQHGPEQCLLFLPRRWRPHRAGTETVKSQWMHLYFKSCTSIYTKRKTLLFNSGVTHKPQFKRSPQFTCDVCHDTLQLSCVVSRNGGTCVGWAEVGGVLLFSEWHDISFSSRTISVASCAPLTNRVNYGLIRNMEGPLSGILNVTVYITTIYNNKCFSNTFYWIIHTACTFLEPTFSFF